MINTILDPLLNCQQVAKILSVSHSLAYKLMRLGIIPSVRIGHSIRVRPTDLETYIKKNIISDGSDTSSAFTKNK